MKTFTAPWSRLLIGVTLVSTALCCAIPIIGTVFHQTSPPAVVLSYGAAGVLVISCALFMVRGYVITPDAILVKRLLWNTKIPRAGLTSAAFESNAMRGSIRTCGNGGFFSFTGWYRNRELGSYRAYVTHLAKTVVLRYGGKTIVMSPGEPQEFVKELGLQG